MTFLDHLKKLDAQATPEPWFNDIGNYEIESHSKNRWRKVVVEYEKDSTGCIPASTSYVDKDLICLLRNNAQAIIELVDSLNSVLSEEDVKEMLLCYVQGARVIESLSKLKGDV
jgi:hypothetical protein